MKFSSCYCAVVEQSEDGLIVHDSGPFPMLDLREALMESTIGHCNHKLVVIKDREKTMQLQLHYHLKEGYPLNTAVKTDPVSDSVFIYDKNATEYMVGCVGRVWTTTVDEVLKIVEEFGDIACSIFFSTPKNYEKAIKNKKAQEFLANHTHKVKTDKKSVQLRMKLDSKIVFSALINELKMFKKAYGDNVGLVLGME